MKRALSLIVVFLLLTGCAVNTSSNVTSKATSSEVISSAAVSSAPVSSDTQSYSFQSVPVSSAQTQSSTAINVEQNPVLSMNTVTLNQRRFIIQLVITKSVKPDVQAASAFAVYGYFDLVVQNGAGEEMERLSLNRYCENKATGFKDSIGSMNISVNYEKTTGIFGLLAACETQDSTGGTPYMMFSVDQFGHIKNLPADTGYIYAQKAKISDWYEFDKQRDSMFHITSVTEAGATQPYEYVWDGEKFIKKNL